MSSWRELMMKNLLWHLKESGDKLQSVDSSFNSRGVRVMHGDKFCGRARLNSSAFSNGITQLLLPGFPRIIPKYTQWYVRNSALICKAYITRFLWSPAEDKFETQNKRFARECLLIPISQMKLGQWKVAVSSELCHYMYLLTKIDQSNQGDCSQ